MSKIVSNPRPTSADIRAYLEAMVASLEDLARHGDIAWRYEDHAVDASPGSPIIVRSPMRTSASQGLAGDDARPPAITSDERRDYILEMIASLSDLALHYGHNDISDHLRAIQLAQ